MRKRGFFWCVIILIVVSIPFLLLENSRFQQQMMRHAIKSYSENHLFPDIQIDSTDLSLIHSRITLYQVVLSDSVGDPFLSVGRLDVNIRLWPLFFGVIDIQNLRLIDADLTIYKENESSDLNITNAIKALSAPKSGSTPLHISSIILKNGSISYDVLSMPEKESFDINHIFVEHINTKCSFEALNKDECHLLVQHFGFEEKHGFQWLDSYLDMDYNHDLLNIRSARLELPTSYIRSDSLSIEHNGSEKSSIRILQPFKVEGIFSTSDFSAFIQNLQLKELNESSIQFSLYASGTANDININELKVNMGDFLDAQGNLWLKSFFDKETAGIESYWEHLKINPEIVHLINPFIAGEEEVVLPAQLERMGICEYSGFFAASLNTFSLSGNISAHPGTLITQIDLSTDSLRNLRFNIDLQSEDFNLQTILAAEIPFGNSSFNIHADGEKKYQQPVILDVDATLRKFRYNGYTYRNAYIDAYYNGNGDYRGKIRSYDKNCLFTLGASMNEMTGHRLISCDMDVKNINLHTLNWIPGKDPDSKLAFQLHSNLKGNSIKDIRGNITIDSLLFHNQDEKYAMNHLSMTMGESDGNDYLLLRSDIINGWLYGICDMSKIASDVKRTVLYRYLPALHTGDLALSPSGNHYEFNFTINNTQKLSKTLSLPVSIPDFALIEGKYNDTTGKFSLKVESNEVTYWDKQIISPYLLIQNKKGENVDILMIASLLEDENDAIGFEVEAMAYSDSVDLNVEWGNSTRINYGELKTQHRFQRNTVDRLTLRSHIQSPDIHVGDSLWTIEPSTWFWDGSRLSVLDFQLHHDAQFLKFNGILSKDNTDTLFVDMYDISLDDLFNLIPNESEAEPFLLGGTITGNGKIASVLNNLQVNADVFVRDFSMNKYVVGDLKGYTAWNNEDKSIAIEASISENDQQTAFVGGEYYPYSDSLYLAINANGMPLDFVTSFTDPTLKLGGRANGLVEIAAPFKESKVGVMAAAYVSDGNLELEPLKTKLFFDDSIFISPEIIRFNNILLHDTEGNPAYLNGNLRHQYFKNIYMDMRISVNHFKVADIEPSPDEFMYGTIYASGTALLTGPVQDLQLDVNARTDEKTAFTISMLNNADVNDYNFIQFVDKKNINEALIQQVKSPSVKAIREAANFGMNLQIEATPSAEITLLTNPNTGDAIKGRGNGSIRISSDKKNDLELYGRYELESGSYEFNIQDLIQRKFDILQGSSVNFSGNPLSGDLDIDATHTVINVSLNDLLDESDIASLNLNRTSIPVNCTLNLSGEIQQPNIQLGLAFPAADEELQRRIMNIINTDEILNRQIVYLLLLNRFAATENTAASTVNNNMTAVVGVTLNTLSLQINKMIYQALGTENLSLDFNYQYEDYGTNNLGEWQVAMTSQLLDNRLIINGNIGSREDLVNKNAQFIGDFDLEYKFSQSGRWRLKMFNRSNDSRYFKSAMTTQGVGVAFKESFNNFSELRQSFVERIAEHIIKSRKESDFNTPKNSARKAKSASAEENTKKE